MCLDGVCLENSYSLLLQAGFQRNTREEERVINAYFSAREIPDECVTLHGDPNTGHATVRSSREPDIW